MNESKLLKIRDVAELLSVNPETLRRWDRAKKLIALKINSRGDRRYRKSDIDKFIKNKNKTI